MKQSYFYHLSFVLGIIPVEGHYPLMEDEDFKKFLVLGPMARYAEDLALMMKVMIGPENVENLDLDSPVSLKKFKILFLFFTYIVLLLLKKNGMMRRDVEWFTMVTGIVIVI